MIVRNFLLVVLVCSCSWVYAPEVGKSEKTENQKVQEKQEELKNELKKTQEEAQKIKEDREKYEKDLEEAKAKKNQQLKSWSDAKAKWNEGSKEEKKEWDLYNQAIKQVDELKAQIRDAEAKEAQLQQELTQLKQQLSYQPPQQPGTQGTQESGTQPSWWSKLTTQISLFFKEVQAQFYQLIGNKEKVFALRQDIVQLYHDLGRGGLLDSLRAQKKLSQFTETEIGKVRYDLQMLESYNNALNEALDKGGLPQATTQGILIDMQDLVSNLIALHARLPLETTPEEYQKIDEEIKKVFKDFGYEKDISAMTQKIKELPQAKRLEFNRPDNTVGIRDYIDINEDDPISLSSIKDLLEERKNQGKIFVLARVYIPRAEGNVKQYYESDVLLNNFFGKDYLSSKIYRSPNGELLSFNRYRGDEKVRPAKDPITNTDIGKNVIEFYKWNAVGDKFEYIGNDRDLYEKKKPELINFLKQNQPPSEIPQQPPQ